MLRKILNTVLKSVESDIYNLIIKMQIQLTLDYL